MCCANITRRPVPTSLSSSYFHSWEDQVLSTFHSELVDEWASSTRRLVLWCCSVRELRIYWFSCLVFPGLSDVVEASTSRFLSLHRETKFIIAFDIVVTLSSPEFSCILVDNTFGDSVITCEISLGHHVCELVSGIIVYDLYFGVKINSIEQPYKSVIGFFPLWSTRSLIRCLQEHETKPSWKNQRLKKEN